MPKIAIIIFLLELYTQIGIIGSNLSIFLKLLSQPSELVSQALDTQQAWTLLTQENILTIIPNDFINKLLTENIFSLLTNLLLLSSLLSLIIGTVVGLAQSRIKRLLAYSTISHIGFILLALAINTEQSIDSLIFYIFQYSITNLNTFLIILALGYILNNPIINKNISTVFNEESRDIKLISELKAQFFQNPLLSLSLAICLFSMAGIPPLIGFFSKQFVLYSAIQSGYYFISLIAIIVSVISASYYLKIIRILFTESTEDNKFNSSFPFKNAQLNKNISNLHSFLISTLTLFILLFVLQPSILLNSTQLLSLSLFIY